MNELRAAAPVLGVDLLFVEVPGPPTFAEALAAIMRERAAVRISGSSDIRFVGLANKNLIPALFGAGEFVEVGRLLSYMDRLSSHVSARG